MVPMDTPISRLINVAVPDTSRESQCDPYNFRIKGE